MFLSKCKCMPLLSGLDFPKQFSFFSIILIIALSHIIVRMNQMETPFSLQLSRETYAIHSACFSTIFLWSVNWKKCFFQTFSELGLHTIIIIFVTGSGSFVRHFTSTKSITTLQSIRGDKVSTKTSQYFPCKKIIETYYIVYCIFNASKKENLICKQASE